MKISERKTEWNPEGIRYRDTLYDVIEHELWFLRGICPQEDEVNEMVEHTLAEMDYYAKLDAMESENE